MNPEFSRPVRIDTIGGGPRSLSVTATPAERAALAARFDLLALDRLEAELSLTRVETTIAARGRLQAEAVQACVATGEPVPTVIEEEFSLLFQPPPVVNGGEDEVELGAEELDVIFYEGSAVDVGDAVAETFALALPPFPRAPAAAQALAQAGVLSEDQAEADKIARSPFAVLKKEAY